MAETIKTYTGPDVGASQCLVTLESFVGDMDNAELADDSTVDTGDAVTAINGLVFSLERREAEIERLRAALKPFADAFDCMERNGHVDGYQLIARQNGDILGHAGFGIDQLRAARDAFAHEQSKDATP